MKENYMDFTHDDAIALLNRCVKNERMLSHCYAAEAVMGALAARLGQEEEKWRIAGLLHDIDIEIVDNDLDRHGLETEKILKEKGVDAEIIDAIIMHNERSRSETFH
jgi:putative nucleotidyltransferase with HDIG domain